MRRTTKSLTTATIAMVTVGAAIGPAIAARHAPAAKPDAPTKALSARAADEYRLDVFQRRREARDIPSVEVKYLFRPSGSMAGVQAVRRLGPATRYGVDIFAFQLRHHTCFVVKLGETGGIRRCQRGQRVPRDWVGASRSVAFGPAPNDAVRVDIELTNGTKAATARVHRNGYVVRLTPAQSRRFQRAQFHYR